MEQVEKLLAEVVENGDLRRKAAIALVRELSAVCDNIGCAAKKAGICGTRIVLEQTGGVDEETGQHETSYYARICGDRVMLVVDEIDIDHATGAVSTRWVRKAIWTTDNSGNDVPLASRHHSVLLARKLEKLVTALRDRTAELVKQTQDARVEVARVAQQV